MRKQWLVMAAGWTMAAQAAGAQLDYAAADGCPDAGRFADEVSARIGAQAFGAAGSAVTVRILASTPTEVLGTLELDAGTRLVRGSSCQEVFDGLVIAAATLLDERPAPAPVTEPAPTLDPKRVKVTLTSTKPGVTVTRITGRGTGVSAGGTVQAVYYEDVCEAPCTFELTKGMHEIGTYGKGTRGMTEKITFDQPEVQLEATPISSAGLIAAPFVSGVGVVAGVIGAYMLGDSCSDWTYTTTPSGSTGSTGYQTDEGCQSRRPLGGALLVGGVAVIGGSVVLMFRNGKIQVAASP